MVGIAFKSGFLARKFLKMAFGVLGASLLQALTQRMMLFAVLFDSFSAECLTFGVRGKVHYAQINSERTVLRFVRIGCRNIKRHCKIECPLAIEQIGLSPDHVHSRLLIPTYTERYQDAPLQGQRRKPRSTL